MRILDEITYLVKASIPVYHHSTDGYIGERVTIDGAFSTYMDALQYIADENYNDFDSGYAFVDVYVTWSDEEGRTYGREFTLDELTPKSYYYGPQPPVPF